MINRSTLGEFRYLQKARVGWSALKRNARHISFAGLVIAGSCVLAARVGLAQSPVPQGPSAEQLSRQGEDLLRSHHALQAKQVLERAAKRDPANAGAWELLGAVYSQLGLKQDAIRAYDNALKLRPKNPLALYNLGALQLGQGRFEDAVRYLQSFHKLQPQNRSVLLALAQCFLSLGRNTEAQTTIDELLAASGNNPELDLRAGELLLAHGQVHSALKPLSDAFHLRPSSDEARLMLAMADDRANQPARVIDLLAEHRIPNSTNYVILLASAFNAERRFGEAAPLLDKTIREQGDQKALCLLLAEAYAGLSKNKLAAKTLQEGHSLWPDDVKIQSALVSQLLDMRDLSGALTVLQKAPEPKLTMADLELLIKGYAARNQLQQAQHYGELAAQRADVTESALIALANVYQIERRDTEAIALLEKNRPKFSTSPRYLYTLAFSYYNRGNFPVSNELLRSVIARDPNLSQAFYLKGSCLASLGKLRDALPQYEAAVRLVPSNALYRSQLGMVLSMLGQNGRAETELTKSIEINDRYAPAHYELAKIYFHSSRYELARQQLEESIRVNPKFDSSYYLLSRVLVRLGKHQAAAAMLKHFNAMNQQRLREDQSVERQAPEAKEQ